MRDRLLDSAADENSPLPGAELVARKVKLLSLMAGAFTPIDGNSSYLEYNVIRDISSCRKLANRWPTPMVWSGFEVGNALPYPAISIERDYSYVAQHPLADAYVHSMTPPLDHPTWDLTAVLFAVLGDRGYFDLSPRGRVIIAEDGSGHFQEDVSGRHKYLILRPEQKLRVLEALVQLCSQPPQGNKSTHGEKEDSP